MDYHTFSVENADRLEDAAARYRHCSAEELVWALAPGADDAVVDLGSGTGFYTDDVAPHVGRVHAVDVQEGMHDRYRAKGVPENVSLVLSDTDPLPFDDDAIDAVYTTNTFHELPRGAVTESARVLRPGGRFVVADWSAEGRGERGPPLDQRHTADSAGTILAGADFSVEFEAVRPETFLLVGVAGE